MILQSGLLSFASEPQGFNNVKMKLDFFYRKQPIQLSDTIVIIIERILRREKNSLYGQ